MTKVILQDFCSNYFCNYGIVYFPGISCIQISTKEFINPKYTVMKQLFFAVLLMAATINVNSQDAEHITLQDIKVGDLLEIGRPEVPRYKHIDFPRPNFIIKKGGIANYKKVEGNKVVVTSLKKNKDGTLKVMIKRADGGRFFNSHTIVSADLENALESGELRLL